MPVLILGAARQGLALARYLAGQGALVSINDRQTNDQLQRAMSSLSYLSINWITGGHPLTALAGIQRVFLSGGVPLDNPIVVQANAAGIPVSNDTQVFLEAVPAPVIGITGSAGKTTTTTLVGRMAKLVAGSDRAAWIGGNIGNPLITDLSKMQPSDLVVLELSSFQLEQLTISPAIGAVLNITPNHLDRHGSMADYTAAKARILRFQSAQDTAILNRDDPGSIALSTICRGQLMTFGMQRSAAANRQTFISNHRVYFSDQKSALALVDVADIQLRGEHNIMNVLAACAIAVAAGWDQAAIRAGVVDFTGVPHRLQFVRDYRGAKWYNDSIATAPERSMAALRSFTEPIILLAGGRDKDLPWQDFARLAHQRVTHIILFGEAGPKIQAALESEKTDSAIKTLDVTARLEEAVEKAASYAQTGYVVLLSPGGTSFDEFLDFEKRGEAFTQWVQQLS